MRLRERKGDSRLFKKRERKKRSQQNCSFDKIPVEIMVSDAFWIKKTAVSLLSLRCARLKVAGSARYIVTSVTHLFCLYKN